ncbi:MAG: hypothetical protein GY856_04780 [bacterium]|nr:hypothetical protein [bacterium]
MTALNAIIDLSHHQAEVDFAAVQADGIAGVIHKATQGTGYVDPTYASRRQQALDAGLFWGAYHFGDGRDAETQAAHFLDTVRPTAQDLLVLDFEANSGGPSMTLDGARSFVSSVHAAVGRWPGLYSGKDIKEALGDGTDPVLANCWFWLAQYGSTAVVPANWSTWTMWQYTDGNVGPEPHSVAGIGACDRDKFNGDLAALELLWGYREP